jgi:hypothetical protein
MSLASTVPSISFRQALLPNQGVLGLSIVYNVFSNVTYVYCLLYSSLDYVVDRYI